MSVVFLDIETTGLEPDRHQIWEIGMVWAEVTETHQKDGYGNVVHSIEFERWVAAEIVLDVDLSVADPMALRIGDYYNRAERQSIRWSRGDRPPSPAITRPREQITAEDAADVVAHTLDGQHIVGAVPSFDAAFLAPWLRANGHAPTWHYHLVDVEALVAGAYALEPPWDSTELSKHAGVDPEQFARHTALGDALWAAHLYHAAMNIEFDFGHPPAAGYTEGT